MDARTPTPAITTERPLAGLAANGAAFVVLSISDAMSKIVVATMPAAQTVMLRALFVLVFLTPYFIAEWRRGGSIFATRRPFLQLTRCLLQSASMVTFFIALRDLPLTTITAIMFISPTLVALTAALILREQIRPPQIVALAMGLVGCLIILRPSWDGGALALSLAVFSAAT